MKSTLYFFLFFLFILSPVVTLAQNINGNNNTVIIQMQGNNNSVNNSSNYNSNNNSNYNSNNNSVRNSRRDYSRSTYSPSFYGTYIEELSKLEKIAGKKARKFIFKDSGVVIFHDGSMPLYKGKFTAEFTDREIVVNIIWPRGDRDSFVINRFNRRLTYDSRKFKDHENGVQ